MNEYIGTMPGCGWCWRHKRGPGRPMKPRMIKSALKVRRFTPVPNEGTPLSMSKEPIMMTIDELEALRLVDYEGLLQEEAAMGMGVSRGTVWRCLDSARRKVATMLIEGRELIIISHNAELSHK